MKTPPHDMIGRAELEADAAAGQVQRSRGRRRGARGSARQGKKLWAYGLLTLSAMLMVNALIGENGYLANLQAQREFREGSEGLRQLKADNARLEDQAYRLKTDPRALEDAARMDLGMIRPGETLIRLRNRPSSRD